MGRLPRGRAAREFAKAELADHRYVMVLHDHQANPHVHLSVRAESRHGKRLNPRKADLHRRRETIAERLRGWGVRADATRQITRGELRPSREPWHTRAREEGRLQHSLPAAASPTRQGRPVLPVEAWARIAAALRESPASEDRELAQAVMGFIDRMPAVRAFVRTLPAHRQREQPGMERTIQVQERTRPGPDMER